MSDDSIRSGNRIMSFILKLVAAAFLMSGIYYNIKNIPTSEILKYALSNPQPNTPKYNSSSTESVKHDPKYNWSNTEIVKYAPSRIEKYIVDHSVELGYDNETEFGPGCLIWKQANLTTPEIHGGLLSYKKDLVDYNNAVTKFKPIPDLLRSIRETGSRDVCATARPHPDGIQALFPSDQLSRSKSGFIEPLTPPMRDQMICENFNQHLMHLDYLVHDFEAMCRTLKPWSKRVLIDMGASFFHASGTPMNQLIDQYEKFGFVFDHIYGFEITENPPKRVYDNMPAKWMPTYHWINVGVSKEEGHKLNPLHSILKTFDEDDFVVIKLDIDTPFIEVPLARQLLEDKDGVYHKLVDQFYFEHHVRLKELSWNWGGSMKGTVKESLDLFYGLREKGIPAHFWP